MNEQQHQELLMKAFGFTAQDLKENQNRKLSQAQIRDSWVKQYWLWKIWLLFVALPLPLDFFSAIVSILDSQPLAKIATHIILFVVKVLLCIGTVIRLRKRRSVYYIQDTIVLGTWFANSRYFVKINYCTFYINSQQFYALQNGREYGIYCTSDFILSVVPYFQKAEPILPALPRFFIPFFYPRRRIDS